MQQSFVFDLNKCTGCQACQIACGIENMLDPEMSWREIITFNEPHYPEIPVFHYSLACNHCIDAPCLKYCPALAISKDTATGVVTIDPDRCIGCKYCSWVCPFNAPKFNTKTNIMEKCTFCSHRLAKNKEPACVTGCPTGALKITDYTPKDYTNTYAFPGFPPSDIKPAIELKPLRKNHEYPEMTAIQKSDFLSHDTASSRAQSNAEKKISLSGEWPLVLFTIAAAALAAMFGARFLTENFSLSPFLFIGLGAGGMGISLLHLGKKMRAARAILNWRRSWISREIIFFTFFMLFGSIFILLTPSIRFIGWIAVTTGFLALFSMDNVYQIDGRLGWTKVHSAQALMTALFISGVLSGQWLLIGWFGFFKAFLYAIRKYYFLKNNKNPRLIAAGFRIGMGLLAPLTIWYISGTNQMALILGCILLGEVIDRCEFYMELELLTPRIKALFDLEVMKKAKEGRKY